MLVELDKVDTDNKERSWLWVGNFDGSRDKLQAQANSYQAELRAGAPQPGPRDGGRGGVKLVGPLPAAAREDKLFGVYVRLADWVAWFLRTNPKLTEADAHRTVFPPLRRGI